MPFSQFILKNKLIFFVILAIPIIFYGLSATKAAQQAENQKSATQPSPVYSQQTNISSVPATPILDPQKRSIDRIEHRRILSSSDKSAIYNIFSMIPAGASSGTLYQSKNIRIEYIHSPNLFQVEILTTDIANAKQEASSWFIQQGVSQQGICDYPVVFYLNYQISHQYSAEQAASFNPLPPGC